MKPTPEVETVTIEDGGKTATVVLHKLTRWYVHSVDVRGRVKTGSDSSYESRVLALNEALETMRAM